ncbi:MAG: YesL family protein [Oscillospiraceae bacterium]|nr:YesL family protein [Oscillospiraceae bacterium]MBO7422238.1 YesL family protein [Oscillospiraceae bacterium]MBO7728298.1 YesL family protein [Oscillospiraceae bacterium]MBP5167935.1 YesL family protein [Oscillospiraceae bacterium]
MKRFEREGKGEPAPSSGLARCGVMAYTHFWKLVAVNLLFVLFSLPVVTLPAAFTALDRVCIIIYRDGNIFLWDEFWKEFRRSFLRTLVPGFCFALLLFGGYFFMSLGNGNLQLGFVAMLFWAVGIFMAMTALLVGEVFFILISVLEIRNFDAMKNALILSLARPARSLGILLILLALLFGAMALMPFSLLLLVFIGVVLAQYPVCCLMYDLVEELILIPFQNRKDKA